MTREKKTDRFQRIAQARKRRVLESLQALGGCSNPASYAYEVEELQPVFKDIIEKLAEVWHRMICHSPHSSMQFRLDMETNLEIGGKKYSRSQLAAMAEVLDLLHETGANFAALEPIRDRYIEQHGNDLCWSFPLCMYNHLGCVLMAVQEGILYLPYNSLDNETYEHFDLEHAKLLTSDAVKNLKDGLLSVVSELYAVLTDLGREIGSDDQVIPENSLNHEGSGV